MKTRHFWRAIRYACPAAGLLLATGCASSVPDLPALETRSGAPLQTGQYPNLNVPAQAAAPQFTDAERDAKIAALKAEGARLAARPGARGGKPDPHLVRLGQDRGQDVLKQIETE